MAKKSNLSEVSHHGAHHSGEIGRINRIIGQLNGIKRMMEEGRYCPDILVQTRASVSAIHALEAKIFEGHLRHCVAAALSSKDKTDAARKIEELVDLFAKNR